MNSPNRHIVKAKNCRWKISRKSDPSKLRRFTAARMRASRRKFRINYFSVLRLLQWNFKILPTQFYWISVNCPRMRTEYKAKVRAACWPDTFYTPFIQKRRRNTQIPTHTALAQTKNFRNTRMLKFGFFLNLW